MLDLSKIKRFEWNKGNINKSHKKHGIATKEAEELFLDEDVILIEDVKHSQKENRFIAIGKSTQNILLFAVFTIRNHKIRIISVRKVNQKERKKYEETT